MREAVVSSFSPMGLHAYGHRFIESFNQFWPRGVKLVLYVESKTDGVGRAEVRSLFAIDEATAFISANAEMPMVCGRREMPCWKKSERESGYSFRTDAVKFCRKVFAVADAARVMKSGILAWVDADVLTFSRVPGDFLPNMLGDHDVAFLDRPGHSECGFIAFRLPEALPLITRWEWFYTSGAFLHHPEFHDSFLFDRAREMTPWLRYRNLAPKGQRGHVWCQSPLAQHMDHCKGERKTLGYSPELWGRRE